MLLNPAPKCRNGFTLTEILVALAIIAVLLVVLLPTLNSTRSIGELTKSLSNVRQLQSANMLYATENGGNFVPIAGWDDDSKLQLRWTSNSEFRKYFGLGVGELWPDGFISPHATIEYGSGSNAGKLRMDRSYGMNKEGMSDWGQAGSTWQHTVYGLVSPAETIAFADAVDWIIAHYASRAYTGDEVKVNHATAYRYDGKAAVVFYDGHTETVTADDMASNKSWWTEE